MSHQILDEVKSFLNTCEPSDLALVSTWVSNRTKELIEKGPPHDRGLPEELAKASKLVRAGASILEDVGKSQTDAALGS